MRNRDIAILAERIEEFSRLSPEDIEAKKMEAAAVVAAAFAASTTAGVAASAAERDSRWKAKMSGPLAIFNPVWYLRTDDGKPPAIRPALLAGLDRTDRTLNERLSGLLSVPPADRPALDDMVRSLSADAWARATGSAREKYVDVLRSIDPYWSSKPWLLILPSPKNNDFPPISILIDNPGSTHDGGLHDDPADDTELQKWRDGIRTWNVDFLRDNPLALAYTKLNEAPEAARQLAASTIRAVGVATAVAATAAVVIVVTVLVTRKA